MSFERVIKDHLDEVAKEDAVFGTKYAERCHNEANAIADCCTYIKGEAKKKAVQGCAVIADAEVFGWAIHFFDENIQVTKEKVHAKVATTADANVARAKEAEKPIQALRQALKPKKQDEGLMSLFNFDEEDE
jgi:hypothetical protein